MTLLIAWAMLVMLLGNRRSPDCSAEAYVRITISLFVICTVTSFASGAEKCPGPDASESGASPPIVGAIRWDAW